MGGEESIKERCMENNGGGRDKNAYNAEEGRTSKKRKGVRGELDRIGTPRTILEKTQEGHTRKSFGINYFFKAHLKEESPGRTVRGPWEVEAP